MHLEDYLQERYTSKTVEAYTREINAFLKAVPRAEKAVYKDVVAYIGVLRNRYSNPATLNRILCSIKAYYDYLHATGKRNNNPARSLRLRDRQSKDIQLQDLFTTAELEKLLERKERYTLLTYRNKVMMSLLIYQGLLPTELERIEITDVNLEKGEIYIRPTHKTNPRSLSLKPMQIMLFFQYLQEIRPQLLKENQSDQLLIGARGNNVPSEDITKHVKRSYKNLFPQRTVNATSIRQSVITNLLKSGVDLRLVQVFAGHKNPSTTEKYKQTNVELLKQAIQKHHPLNL